MSDIQAELAAEMEEAAREAPPVDKEDALASLKRLAEEVERIDDWMERSNKLIKERAERRNRILSAEMVDIMDTHSIPSVTVGARTFNCENYYHASIPEEHRDEAHTWLEQHDAGDLIKREVIATFPKDSEDEAKELCRYITERYQMATVEEKRGVPWARLTSWFKSLFDPRPEGAEPVVFPPMEIMGAKVGRIVKIKEPKKKL